MSDSARFTVDVVDAPTAWNGLNGIRVVWQSRIRPAFYIESVDNRWEMELPLRDGRWSGNSVGKNGDGRRFVYLAWLDAEGKMFRRIKLYQDQVAGESVSIAGRMSDGSPACSTARVVGS